VYERALSTCLRMGQDDEINKISHEQESLTPSSFSFFFYEKLIYPFFLPIWKIGVHFCYVIDCLLNQNTRQKSKYTC